MGITPISNLLPTSFASPAASAIEPLPMARVENSGRTGDDAYSPSNGKPARGSEDDTEESDEEEFEDDVDPVADLEPGEPPLDASRGHDSPANDRRAVSFFA